MSKHELGRKDYQAALDAMQDELTAMAGWASEGGARVLVILEGRDTAGKTGAINAIAQKLNPRQVRTVALQAPTEREKTQWYFQRYVPHLPAGGEIVLFDRSWYNRAGVEKVMGFAAEAQVDAFLEAVPTFERMLVDDGLLLFKYWLTCDQAEQEERLAERRDDPAKRWKISPIDVAARGQYRAYTEAREAMLKASHTRHAPWTLVDFNDQRRGRLTLVRDLLDRLPVRPVKQPVPELPPLAEPPAKEHFGVLKPLKAYPDT
ncbi:MAG: polyphosphate kinase 2 [Novosphingobium sp.]|nr:polyphosphate kinase 2 [Novosphingobium sp.]